MPIVFKSDAQAVHGPDRSTGQREPSRFFRIALLTAVGCSLLAILSSFLGDGGLMVILQQRRVKQDLLVRITAEEMRSARLSARVEALKNDPTELERVAREELGLVREREIVFDFRTAPPR
jgi:cell division protein FtsB